MWDMSVHSTAQNSRLVSFVTTRWPQAILSLANKLSALCVKFTPYFFVFYKYYYTLWLTALLCTRKFQRLLDSFTTLIKVVWLLERVLPQVIRQTLNLSRKTYIWKSKVCRYNVQLSNLYYRNNYVLTNETSPEFCAVIWAEISWFLSNNRVVLRFSAQNHNNSQFALSLCYSNSYEPNHEFCAATCREIFPFLAHT